MLAYSFSIFTVLRLLGYKSQSTRLREKQRHVAYPIRSAKKQRDNLKAICQCNSKTDSCWLQQGSRQLHFKQTRSPGEKHCWQLCWKGIKIIKSCGHKGSCCRYRWVTDFFRTQIWNLRTLMGNYNVASHTWQTHDQRERDPQMTSVATLSFSDTFVWLA